MRNGYRLPPSRLTILWFLVQLALEVPQSILAVVEIINLMSKP